MINYVSKQGVSLSCAAFEFIIDRHIDTQGCLFNSSKFNKLLSLQPYFVSFLFQFYWPLEEDDTLQ